MAFTFPGGIHLKDHKKLAKDKPIKEAPLPKKVIIPLVQHIGVPCSPLVKVGDIVKTGQRIGDSERFISSPVHASVSGKVTAIEPKLICTGVTVMSIIIESDGIDELHESIKPFDTLDKLDKKAIRSIVRGAGIVGLGGATFPTHVKLDPPYEKKIEHIILNGAECEPYITCDHRTMLERPKDVITGLKAIMKTTDAEKGIIAIEDNKPEAIKIIKENLATEDNLSVVVLKTKYPQGGEKQLIKAVTGKEVPSGGLPMDVSVIVNNIGTAVAIADAINKGMPIIERAITVTGDAIKEPANLKVRLGTPLEEVINMCGGFSKEAKKIIFGGPMMGFAQYNMESPIIKNTNNILVLSEKHVEASEESTCVRCAKCVDICPTYLQPLRIAAFAKHERYEDAAKIGAMDCIECGLCTYTCPAKIELVHRIKLAKLNIKKAQAKE